jgi:hypothetical protein
MSHTTVSLNIDLEDVLWGMTSREKQELTDELYSDGYIPAPLIDRHTDNFSDACKKLIGQAWRLTHEEEQFIINISKRF